MSKVTIDFEFDFDAAFVMKRIQPGYTKAQEWLDNQVLVDCEPYLPFRTGNLRNSGIRGTHIGSGQVIYNAPYAREVYYNPKRNYRRDKHPKAQSHWFEEAKKVHEAKWVNGAKQMFKRSTQ